jgi:DNA-binding beta-propeller fold protein YncE
MNTPRQRIDLAALALALAICLSASWHLSASSSVAAGAVPGYHVDVNWPKTLPDQWVIGGLGGVCVDHDDHVFILNRQDVLPGDLNAGHLAPPIIELDSRGAVLNSWGDSSQLDPRLHSCTFDPSGNIWIGSAPSGMIQKYSHDGKRLLQQIGKKGVVDSSDGTPKGKPLNSSAPIFFMPSGISVDRTNGDIYVSDGESRNGNQRVAVFNAAGEFLRQWHPEGMQTVHCMELANDGTVYVCNREGSRIQLYDRNGGSLRNIELLWKPVTPPAGGHAQESGGSAVSIAFSRDPEQRLLYVINQNNSVVEVLERKTGAVLTEFGGAGHFPGQFDQPHGIAVDSKGAVYVTENRGRRVQRFVPDTK